MPRCRRDLHRTFIPISNSSVTDSPRLRQCHSRKLRSALGEDLNFRVSLIVICVNHLYIRSVPESENDGQDSREKDKRQQASAHASPPKHELEHVLLTILLLPETALTPTTQERQPARTR